MTGSDASAQNSIAEYHNVMPFPRSRSRPRILVVCLDPYSLYKNRIPHSHIKITPFELITYQQLDITNLQIFRASIYAKKAAPYLCSFRCHWGVIDSEYRDQIKVLLQNLGDHDVIIKGGQGIAQMIYEKAVIPKILVIETLSKTEWHTNRFGSTERAQQHTPVPDDTPTHEIASLNVILFDISKISDLNLPIICINRNMITDISPLYQILLGINPFDNVVEIEISIQGKHSILVMHITGNHNLVDGI